MGTCLLVVPRKRPIEKPSFSYFLKKAGMSLLLDQS